MTTMIVKLAAAVTCMGLAWPGVASAGPVPGVPDIPGVDESFAMDYGVVHDREVCRILDRQFFKNRPDMVDIDSAITEVAAQGGFNDDTATFVVGVAMSSACREHTKKFEHVLGVEFE